MYACMVSIYKDANPDAQSAKLLTVCSSMRQELWKCVFNAGYHVFLVSLLAWLYT